MTAPEDETKFDNHVQNITDMLGMERRLHEKLLPLIELVRNAIFTTRGFALPPEEVFLSGSFVEGSFHSRGFKHLEPILEIDIMFSVAKFCENGHNLTIIEPKPEQYGFYYLRNSLELKNYVFDEFKEYYVSNFSQSEFLSAFEVKNFVKKKQRFSDDDGITNAVISSMFNLEFNNLDIEVCEEIAGPSAMLELVFKERNSGKLLMTLSVDKVPSIRLATWPDQGSIDEWTTRERKWPSHQICQDCVKKCHLVPKESPEAGSHFDWRVSFSEAETFLCQTYDQHQRTVYSLFKAIFYKFLKMENGLSSYCCKTVMFHTMEQYGDQFGNKCYRSAVETLLRNLFECTRRKWLPSFFDKRIDILRTIPSESLDLTAAIIYSILGNLDNLECLDSLSVKIRFSETTDRLLWYVQELEERLKPKEEKFDEEIANIDLD